MSQIIPFLFSGFPVLQTNKRTSKKHLLRYTYVNNFPSPDYPSKKALLYFHSTHLSLLLSKSPSTGHPEPYYLASNLPLFSDNDRIESLEGDLQPGFSKYGSFCPISVNNIESLALVWLTWALVYQVQFCNSFLDNSVRMSASTWELICFKLEHRQTW